MGNVCCRRKREGAYIDHENRFLEDMLDIYKVDVDQNKQELNEIQACVEERLRNATKHLKDTDLEVANIILCGSMSEGTRIWQYEPILLEDNSNAERILSIEFDFLAVLRTSVSEHEDKTSYQVGNGECKGYNVIHSIGANSKRLQPDVIRHDLRNEIVEYLNKDTVESRLVYHPVRKYPTNDPRINYKFLWKSCKLYKKSITTSGLSFKQHNTCIVNVDLMPAFLYVKPNEMDPRYLVTKSNCSHNVCFMESYCMEEIRVLLEASQIHRDVYILLKAFSMQTSSEFRASSYCLKTAVLRHIETCDCPGLVACHRDLLQYLSRLYSRNSPKAFRGERNLLSGSEVSPGKRLIFSEFYDFLKEVLSYSSVKYSFRFYKKMLDSKMRSFADMMDETSIPTV